MDRAQDSRLLRRSILYAAHREVVRRLFDSSGRIVDQQSPANGYHSLLPLAIPFLYGSPEERAFGNAILRSAPYFGGEFSLFTTLRILLRDRETLEDETVLYLEGFLDRFLRRTVSIGHQFHGINYNQAAMSTFEMIVGGEYAGAPAMVEHGLANLYQVRENFVRDGVTSEYTSPTYSPITILAFEEIANLAAHHTATDLARKAAARVWLEIASFYHAPSMQLAGPISRAYTIDSAGNMHILHVLLYYVFGEDVVPSPADYLYSHPEQNFIHNDFAFMCHHVPWMLSAEFHPSKDVENLLLRKEMPYLVLATTEHSECSLAKAAVTPEGRIRFSRLSTINFACKHGFNRAYLTSEYGMGTGTIQWHDGMQTEPFFFTCRNKAPARTVRDKSTLFTRFMMDDHVFAADNYYRFYEKQTNRDFTANEGTSFTLQRKNLAILCTHPRRFVTKSVHRLRLAAITPLDYGAGPDEIVYGGESVEGFDAAFGEERTIFLRFGRAFLALRPLIGRVFGREKAVRFSVENGFGVISLIGYEGPPRDFDELEIVSAGNGFVAEAATAEEMSFEQFRETACSGRVVDQFYFSTRKVRYLTPGQQLFMEFSPSTLFYKQRTINGLREKEPKFSCSMINDPSPFPWLGGDLGDVGPEYGDWPALIAARGDDFEYDD